MHLNYIIRTNIFALNFAGIDEYAPRILPSLILLFDGLKRAYEAQKDADDSDDR